MVSFFSQGSFWVQEKTVTMGLRGMWDEGIESLSFRLVLALVFAVGWSLLSVPTHKAGFCCDVVNLDLAHGIHYWNLWPRVQRAVCCLGFVRVQWQSFCWDGSILDFSDVISPCLQEHTSPPRTDCDFSWGHSLESPPGGLFLYLILPWQVLW